MQARLSWAFLIAWCMLGAEKPVPRDAPAYTAASIVNAADNQSGSLAPNAIGTIYGVNLAYSTAAAGQSNTENGLLPAFLGTNESETIVLVNNYPAGLYYVSPLQINFLVPPNLVPGPVSVVVLVGGLAGPTVSLTLAQAAPGLFELPLEACQLPSGVQLQCVVATEANGSVLTPMSAANPGDIVILWATGLGPTESVPPENYLQIPSSAASLIAGADLSILLDGVAVDPGAIDYAGQAPGFAGLYQINLTLPASVGSNPEIRLQLDGASSIAGVHLPVSP
jgi:uncharacterized protein (TIGR03437 family)